MRLLIALSFFFLTNASAETCPNFLATVKTEFEAAYFNRNAQPDYFAGWCPNNIYRLTTHLKNAQLDLSKAEVWYIYRRDEKGEVDLIFPARSRSWAGSGWMFHVVLNLDGMVLDMDYGSEPTFEPLEEYAGKMFPASESKNLGLLVKVVPAQEFLRDYIRLYSEYPRSMLNPKTDALYPPQDLLQAVSSRVGRHSCQ